MEFRNSKTSNPVPVTLSEKRQKRRFPHDNIAKDLADADRSFSNKPTIEAEQHAIYISKVNSDGTRRIYNTTVSNLDYYRKRGIISNEQFIAAESLYRDFYNSRMVAGFKSCLDVRPGGGSSQSNRCGLNFQAYESYVGAMEAIRGKRVKKLIFNVCCMGEWLKDCDGLGILPHRRADAFQRALTDLIEYYERRLNPRKIMKSFNASMDNLDSPITIVL